MTPEPDSSEQVSPRRVVITQATLFSIGGSEMVTVELAEYFSGVGDEVLVVTFGVGHSWAEEFAALDRVTVLRYDDPELDRKINAFAPTVVWVHHQIVPEVLMRAPKGIKFIFHHMSITHPIEFPVAYRVERALVGAIVFVSPEALADQLGTGLLDGIPADRLGVLGNPAPQYFSRTTEPRRELKSVLLVSNHAPSELAEALDGMSATCDVVSLGANTELQSRMRRIVPSDLDRADAVVSIGKTVQFGLVTGTPVYCYDIFGGPGWLNESNFELARFHNFSGRGFERKTASTIREELTNGYAAAAQFAASTREKHAAEFRLDHVLEALIATVSPHGGGLINPADVTAHDLELSLRNGLMNAIEARNQTIAYLECKLEVASSMQHPQAQPSLRERMRSRLWRTA